MDARRRSELIDALEKKNVRLPCSRCGAIQFEIVGESSFAIKGEDAFPFPEPDVYAPTVVVACSSCGHIWQHALGSLGIKKG